jgi:HAD superfamily hydrolase (TIGR01509 family)
MGELNGIETGKRIRKKTEMLMLETMERDGMPMKPGVREILEWLKKHGYRIAMASSSSQKSVRHHLERAEILDYFETLTTGDMVKHSKPQPDIYQKACESIGQKPENCYAIEDSPNGIRSAYSAGMKVIMVPDLQQPDEEIQGKICGKCDSLLDVIAWLDREKEKDDSHCNL